MDNLAIQITNLKQIVVLADLGSFDMHPFKRQILAKMTNIFKTKPHDFTPPQQKALAQMKVNSLMSLDKILKYFDTDTIVNEMVKSILDLLNLIRCSLGYKDKAILMSSFGVIDAIGKHVDGHTVALHVLPGVIPHLINPNIKDRQHSPTSRVCRFMMDKSIGYRTDKTSGGSGSSRDSNSSTRLQTTSFCSSSNNAFNFSSNTVGISSPTSNGYFNEEKSIFSNNSSFAASSDLGNMGDLSFFDNIDIKLTCDIKDSDAANEEQLHFVLEADLKSQDTNTPSQGYNPVCCCNGSM